MAVLSGVVWMSINAKDADRTRFPEYTAVYRKYVPWLPLPDPK